MKTIEYTTIDKSDWPRGPWDTEVDKRQWLDPDTQLPCMIRRAGPERGHWCGYVAVPKGHPAHGKDYDDIDVDVHGGLTYAEGCSHGNPETSICHLVEPGEDDDVWWLGFDCAHAGDLSPGMSIFGLNRIERYWTETDVTAETLRLAQKLKNMEV